MTSIGRNVFSGCNALEKVEFNDSEGWTIADNVSAQNWVHISVADANLNSEYFRTTYASKYWKKCAHELEVLEQIDATCIADGSRHVRCTICQAEMDEVVLALGHDYSNGFTEDKSATCMESGSKSKHCSRCDSINEVTAIPALGHDYSTAFTIDKQATCTENGSKSRHCTRCDEKIEVKILDALHDKSGNTMITITHDMRCAEALCDRAVLIADGKVNEQGGKELAHKYFFEKKFVVSGC